MSSNICCAPHTDNVAYRRYRSFLRRYIDAGPMVSQVEKIMVLFVESGIVYSVIWVRIPSH